MIRDAETNKEADQKKREEAETRNQADALAHSIEKSLEEHGDKISTDDKTAIETSITNLKDALKGSDSELIKQETENLSQVSMKLGEAIYKSQQEQTETPTEDFNNDDDVVDAEFTTVDDKP